jgi:GTP-binding protein YchF
MELAIIGLARSGKTSLFNAVTRGSAPVGTYTPDADPNVGVAQVPDARLDRLSELFHPKKHTPAEIRWVDYPVAGFGPEGPGSRFLQQLSRADALVHVARAFEDAAVPHPDGAVDAHRDVEALDLELAVADLGLIERRLDRIASEARSIKAGERGRLERDRELLTRLQTELEAGHAIRALELSEADRRDLVAYQFLTRLPVLLIVNIGEADLPDAAEIEREFAERHGGPGVAVAALCTSLEAELSQLDPAEAEAMRADLGVAPESPAGRAVAAAYDLLGLLSFLTVGEDECRAWTVRLGAAAPEAAGKIHTDLEHGFIRAEVANWEELLDAGSLAELKKRGRLRTEGKSYVVQDGDVLNILFNL